MRLILLVFMVSALFAQESCYTVQLTSVFKTDKSLKEIESTQYDESCKSMSINKNIAVRCGCFEKFKDAKATLPSFQKSYKNAYVMSTYKSRFEPKIKPIFVDAPIVEITPPLVVQTKKETENDKLKGEKKEAVAEKKVIVKTTKKKKKKKKKNDKLKKKSKYVKKHQEKYFYDRYLQRLKNNKGIGPYDYRYKFGAQLSYDVAYINESSESYFRNDWRRIRVYHQGSFLDKKLFYELEYSFTGENNYKDNFIGYEDKLPVLDLNYRIKAGNIKIPFSLERYSSSKNITFMERALSDAFAESRKLGVELLLRKKIDKNHLNLFVAGFSNSIDEKIDNKVEQPGISIRGTYAYKFRKKHLLSLGGTVYAQDMKGEDVKFKQGSESEFVNTKYLSASIKQVDTLQKRNVEGLYIYDNYSLQGELSVAKMNAINKSDTGVYTDYEFYGYYLQGSYFVFGGSKRYKFDNSSLGKVKPKDNALEIALRYSYLNLNSEDEDNNGEQTDYTFGLNYYINKDIKAMINYVVAEPKNTKEYDGRLQLLEARILVAF